MSPPHDESLSAFDRANQRNQSHAARSALRQLVGVAMDRADATVRSAEVALRAGGAATWSRSWVSRWLAGEAPATEEQIALLLEHVDSVPLAEAAAWLAGGTFSRAEGPTCSVLGALARHTEAHAAALSLLTRALDDGEVSPGERAEILAAIDREQAALSQLRARVAAPSTAGGR